MRTIESLAAPLTTIAAGVMVGFLGVGALAQGFDLIEAGRCPGVTRVQVNTGTVFKDWAAWGACPRAGLTAPLKP